MSEKAKSVIGLVPIALHNNVAEVALNLPKSGRHLIFTFKSLSEKANLKKLENLTDAERDRYGKNKSFECVVVGGSVWTATDAGDRLGYGQQDKMMAAADGVYIGKIAQRHGFEITNDQHVQYIGVDLDKLTDAQLECVSALRSVAVKLQAETKK